MALIKINILSIKLMFSVNNLKMI